MWFQRSNPDQNEAWAKAINYKNPDGSLRYYRIHERICSKHFINGMFSTDPQAPNYKPYIYIPTLIQNSSEPKQVTEEPIFVPSNPNVVSEEAETDVEKAPIAIPEVIKSYNRKKCIVKNCFTYQGFDPFIKFFPAMVKSNILIILKI